MRWLPFVGAAIVAAATAGFGYGVAAAAASAAGAAGTLWWLALAQAHGHIQLFGWCGLMVLGVGFFFLPRLRGAPLAAPSLLPWILGLMCAGLLLRAVTQPGLALGGGAVAAAGLAMSGVLELVAATLAVGTLAVTARRGPPLRQRQGLAAVLPYLIVSFAALWLSLAVNAVLALLAGLSERPLLPPGWDDLTVQIGLAGFLVPVSVAVSARSFPLFMWLRVPSIQALRLAFVPFLTGLLLRWWGAVGGSALGTHVGELLEGMALVAFAVILQVVPTRRREGTPPLEDRHYTVAVGYLLVPAYLWLVAAGLVDIGSGVAVFGVQLPLSPDLERHALGSGFITLLIFGMGQRMLPGFAGARLANVPLVWATAVLGNLSAMLRVGPVLALGAGITWLSGAADWALAVAGVLGMGAVLCFGANLWMTLVRGRRDGGRHGHTGAAGPR